MQPEEDAMRSRVIQGETSSTQAHVPVVDLANAARPRPEHPLLRVLAQVPFTLAVGGLVLLLGVVTGALWNPLVGRPLLDDVAYGLPALQEGRWWTPLTGLFFAQAPAQYVATLGSFLVLCGFAEFRLGTRRVIPVALGTQLAATLGAAALLAAGSGHGWAWADATAQVRDLG